MEGNQAPLRDDGSFVRWVFDRQLAPAILSVAGVTASMMANSIIAGNLLGPEALAVLSVVSPLSFVFATLGSLLGAGGAAVAAWRIGRDEKQGGDAVFTLTLALLLMLGLALTGLGLGAADGLVRLLGADDVLFANTLAYCLCFLPGGLGIAGVYLPYFFFKLAGRMGRSVGLFVLLAALNIGLDLLFVLAFDMGVAGIGLATAVANLLAAGIGLFLLLGPGGSFSLVSLRGQWRQTGRLLLAGSPASLNNLASMLRTLALNRLLLAVAGAAGVSVFGGVMVLSNLSLTVINGVCQTVLPFIGVFSSERDTASIRQFVAHAARRGLLLTLPLSASLAVLAQPIGLALGLRDPQTLDLCITAVRLFALSLPGALLSNLLISCYHGGALVWLANLLAISRGLVFPLLTALLLTPRLGTAGVWLCFGAAEVATWLLLGAILLCRRGKSRRQGLLQLDSRLEQQGAYISFSVRSSVEEIMNASQRISDFCDSNRLEPQQTMLISLALEEMLVSIREHCFAGDDGQTIAIRILIADPDAEGNEPVIILRIRCAGVRFDPIAYYRRRSAGAEEPEALDDSLGIAMIVAAAQVVEYQSTFGVNNLMILL